MLGASLAERWDAGEGKQNFFCAIADGKNLCSVSFL